MKRLLVKLVSLIAVFIILLSLGIYADSVSKAKTSRQAFDEFLREQFIEYVTEDTITLHYLLRYPENYGIGQQSPTLGEFGIDQFFIQAEKNKAVLSSLDEFNYASLSYEQQVIYDTLRFSVEADLCVSTEDYFYLVNVLSLTSGVQAEFPILLAEYQFYSEDDVVEYLDLLTMIEPYFNDVLRFEQEKSERGLFMADFTADAIIKQCYDFTSEPEQNFLIDTFDEKINSLNLSPEVKMRYIAENKEKILTHVIPSFTLLAEGLSKLKGTGVNDGGLCMFENGKKYYEYLAKSLTGSDKSVDRMAEMLDESLTNSIFTLMNILQNNPEVFDHLDAPASDNNDPMVILDILKSSIVDFFPEDAGGEYTVKYIHPSLEESLSPAFYMIPPIDDFSSNVIYINKSRMYNDYLFYTLAHEGYPGHLYQTVYFCSKNPDPIRRIFRNSGYIEGWATYAELESYGYTSYAMAYNDLVELLRADAIFRGVLQTRADIGVNYNGWSENDLYEYFSQFGISDREVCRAVYEQVIQDPANALQYYIGYLEIAQLKEYASEELGEKFDLLGFNRCLLDIGPAPFPIIRTAVQRYISDLTDNKSMFSITRIINNKLSVISEAA